MDKKIKRYWQGDLSIKEMNDLLSALKKKEQELEEEEIAIAPTEDSAEIRRPEKISQSLQEIHRQIDRERPSLFQYLTSSWMHWTIAAAALLIFGLSLYWFISAPSMPIDRQAMGSGILNNDILLPADSIPTVRLPDGKIRTIDGVGGGKIKHITGINPVYDKDGSIVYQVVNPDRNSNVQQNGTVVFSSPKGYKSKIRLLDGTLVWLNSGSSIEYPLSWGTTRLVKLSGEGYFEVAHNAHQPFEVHTGRGAVRVLGTVFNITSYPDDQDMTTTLINGSIQLSSKSKNIKMIPGQQIVLNKEGNILKDQQVDIAEYISWKDGYFSFNDVSIKQLLDKVRHWYNIDAVIYKTTPTDRITGTFKQAKSLKSLLNRVEEISNLKFIIEERRIIVQ